jgi:hypothetical protein
MTAFFVGKLLPMMIFREIETMASSDNTYRFAI